MSNKRELLCFAKDLGSGLLWTGVLVVWTALSTIVSWVFFYRLLQVVEIVTGVLFAMTLSMLTLVGLKFTLFNQRLSKRFHGS